MCDVLLYFILKVPKSSQIVGTRFMNNQTVSSRVFVHRGFLNMLTVTGGAAAWKLTWFKLSDHVLEYWNSSSDEEEKVLIFLQTRENAR